jgi:CheY-like chemotaxis protein
LIVDDHDGFRRFVRGPLEAAGFTVAEAATGAEATEAARTVRPGLVLLDIQLPDFDGFEVARRLAADPAGGSAPVVMLTSTREASDYGGRIAASRPPGSCPRISCPALRCAGSWPGSGQNYQFWSCLAGWQALGAGDRVRVSGSGPASRGLRLRWCERRRCG